jgi:hypothetical protein
MEKVTEEEDPENVIGTKTATASKVILINKTGSEISALYVRENSEENDDDEWGDELIQEAFTLKNGEKAVYYYEKGTASLYDLRITYTEEDKNECFFRKIPLPTISQISLCMDGTGEDAIPYAKYLTGTSTKEYSTLNEVKKRLGLLDDDSDSEDGDDEDDSTSDDKKDSNDDGSDGSTPTSTPVQTTAPEPSDSNDPDPSTDDPSDQSDGAAAAENCIGQSLDALFNACGDPLGNDYQDEPESGMTGYYYYDDFTVSTMVDDDGNEIVVGVW